MNVPVILQRGDVDCGPACVAMIACALGHATDIDTVSAMVTIEPEGSNALALAEAARGLGFDAVGVQFSRALIMTGATPFIAHWEGNHFVVVEEIERRRVTMVDPRRGRVRVSIAAFELACTGVALLIRRGHGTIGHAVGEVLARWRQP